MLLNREELEKIIEFSKKREKTKMFLPIRRFVRILRLNFSSSSVSQKISTLLVKELNSLALKNVKIKVSTSLFNNESCYFEFLIVYKTQKNRSYHKRFNCIVNDRLEQKSLIQYLEQLGFVQDLDEFHFIRTF